MVRRNPQKPETFRRKLHVTLLSCQHSGG